MDFDGLDRLREIWDTPWEAVSRMQLYAVIGATALLAMVYASRDDGWLPLVDSLNLVFHEAGHPIFGIFGFTIGFLGGTIMQLLVPFIVMCTAWARRNPTGTSLAGIWMFQNGLNISRYIADARAMELPLVGGGVHDWNTLLGEWGLLHRDLVIAGGVRTLAWIGMISCCLWLLWRKAQAARS
jgi:hypothetical protein